MPVAAAIVGGSVVAGGASIIGANKAAKSSQNATDQTTALQREIYNQQRTDNAPYLASGTGALGAINSRFGLTGPADAGAPSSNPLAAVGGGAPAAANGGFDGDAYLAANPDVAAEFTKVNGPGLAQALGLSSDPRATLTPQQFAAWHYQTSGQSEGRQATMVQAPQVAAAAPAAPADPAAGPGAINPNNNSLASLISQVSGARPAIDTRPVAIRPTMAPLDVSQGSYVESPDYKFQVQEGNKNILTNKSAFGRLESGDAMKAIQKFGQDYGLKDYAQWRDYTTGQYNQDRSVGNANFNFDATRGDQNFNTDRAFTTDIYNYDQNTGINLYNGRTNDLFKLAGMGQGAVTQGAASGNTYATNTGNALFSNAATQGNAALATAGAIGNTANSFATAYAGYRGQQQPGSLLSSYQSNPLAGLY